MDQEQIEAKQMQLIKLLRKLAPELKQLITPHTTSGSQIQIYKGVGNDRLYVMIKGERIPLE